MTNRDWDRARRQDKARRPAIVPGPFDPEPAVEPNKPKREPFPIVYARYANAQRSAGRKPLPPKQWIAELRKPKGPAVYKSAMNHRRKTENAAARKVAGKTARKRAAAATQNAADKAIQKAALEYAAQEEARLADRMAAYRANAVRRRTHQIT